MPLPKSNDMPGSLYPVTCTECGVVTGYSFHPTIDKTLCFLCCHNICELAELLGGLPNVPTVQQLYTTPAKENWVDAKKPVDHRQIMLKIFSCFRGY